MAETFEEVPVDGNKPKNLLASSPALIFLQGPPPLRRVSAVYDIKVGNPQKVTTDSKLTANYVAYTVKTVVKATGQEQSVMRRYSDFVWFHEYLCAKYPLYVIPPLPEKSITARFAAALVEYRIRELERFLQRVAAHPVLGGDENMAFFLTAAPADFAKHPNAPLGSPADEETTSGGVFGSFMRISKTATQAVNTLQDAMSKPLEDPDGWFADTAARVDQVESAVQASVQATTAWINTFLGVPPAFGGLGSALRVVGRVLNSTDQWSATAASHVTNSSEQCQVLSADLVTQVERYFQQSLTDYVRELHAVRAVLEYRTSILRRHSAAVRAAQVAREKGKDPAEADRLRDAVAAELEDASRKMRQDIDRVMEERRVEFHHVLRGLAALQMEYAMQCADSWKELAVRMPADTASRSSLSVPAAVAIALTTEPAPQPSAPSAPAAAPAAAVPNPFASPVDQRDSPFAQPQSSLL